VAAGNLLVVLITRFGGGHAAGDASVTPGRFMLYALMTFGVSAVFVFVAMFYRYRDTPEAVKNETKLSPT
jgi:hypothetical protein